MLIHEKVVLPAHLRRIAALIHPFFPNYGKKGHSVCSKKKQMKMAANQEAVFGQRSNHRARS
jgi:hypothetical protein